MQKFYLSVSVVFLMIFSINVVHGTILFDFDSLYKIPVEAKASSVFRNAVPDLVLDSNLNTSWVSDNPYPDRYYANPEQNSLLNKTLQSNATVSLAAATDGLLGNFTPTIPLVNGQASVWYDFSTATDVFLVGARLRGLSNQPVVISLCDSDGNCSQQSYLPSQNNANVRFTFALENITRIQLSSTASFAIYDLAVVAAPIEEYVRLDFEESHLVKQIHTKHWAGNQAATASFLWLSEDGTTWVKIADLDPNQLSVQQTILESPVKAKHLKLSHRLVQENFKKSSIFEIDVLAVVLQEPSDDDAGGDPSHTPADPVQWDPHAGVYRPFSQGSIAFSSSDLSTSQASNVLDNDFSSAWLSNNPLPDRYVSNPSQNILLGIQGTASNGVSLVQATDGNLGNFAPTVQAVNGEAWVRLSFNPRAIHRYSMRLGANFQENVSISFRYQGQSLKTVFYAMGTSGHQRFVVEESLVDEIYISSPTAFTIQELAAYSEPLEEWVTVDLGEVKNVGWIRARYWNGTNNSVSAALYAGETLEQLVKIQDLNPTRLNFEDIVLAQPIAARYVRIAHRLVDENFKRASVQELMVFDEFGSYGPKPTAKPQQHSFGDLFGINTVWAWGTNKVPNLQGPNEGAQKFIRAGSQARNYHNIHWDTTDPDITPDYTPGIYQIRNQWTQWHREYADWKTKGFTVDVTYTFDRFREDAWDTPYASAYNLGQAFGQVYGPRNLNLVRTVEVGNEPWDYSDSTYVQILEGMAKGLKEADPGFVVLPAALQAADPGLGNTGVSKHYMGNKLSSTAAAYLDGINLHLYSYVFGENGVRVAVQPEHPQSRMQEIYAGIRFRDANMPGKQIHVTEWGWDSSSANELAINNEAVSSTSQALYLVRGLLWLSRMGIDRAHWYFYANVPIETGQPVNHDRSGLTESRLFNFQEKRSFIAAEAVKNLMADLYFDHIIQEDEQAYIYALRNQAGEFSHLIAWRPVVGDDTLSTNYTIAMDRSAEAAHYISGLDPHGESVHVSASGNELVLPLSSKPLLVRLGAVLTSPPPANTARLSYRVERAHTIFELTTEQPVEELGEVLFRKGSNALADPSLQELQWEKVDERRWRAQVQEMMPGTYILKADLSQHEIQSNVVDLMVDSRVRIFPNPVQAIGYLELIKPFEEETRIQIINIHGKVEREIVLPMMAASCELNLSNLKNGIYLIQVQNQQYLSQTRVIKNGD
ncbi:T9SS type A sorting domain-containing protein [Mongoliitalea daihaiensis]|uniref:T9SS type A sorting domain-containing protein n=1 Tax=Mongoliitalea daihaiensis TaxID=2782006 RepID=UPI001F419C67|nr:T9SS type A sorting domain-containing protein [Mongoliitalea daihaiensis]UJP66801.1 T9SS type A sorting domain-containing protein [Mongoliitalea daihaiensis]